LPFKDEDNDLYHWCEFSNTVDGGYSPFWCSKIKCVMERLLDTGDSLYDWAFDDEDNGDGIVDYMRVLNGRASLWISKDKYSTAFTAP